MDTNAAATVGDDYKIPAPNTSLVGNCYILFLTYKHGFTPSITDTNGNTWPSASFTADAGVNNMVMSVFVLKNISAGLNTLTVHFGTQFAPFAYRWSEWNNIDQANPVNNGIAAANVAAPNLATGSFTTTTDGCLILAYFASATGVQNNSNHPSLWTPGGSFTLLDADIAWFGQVNGGFPQASMQFIQPVQGSINPGITATGDTTNGYNCVAIAVKPSLGAVGSPRPSGIYINKILHNSWRSNGATLKLQFPTTGNLRVIRINHQGVDTITSITDSDSNTYTQKTLDTTTPQYYFAANQTANPNCVVTINFSGNNRESARLLDISGAASAPFDVYAGVTDADRSGLTTLVGPTITPTTSNGLVLMSGDLAFGPGLAITSPTSTWDLCTYTGETDNEDMENADCDAHFYNPDTSTLNVAYTITNNNPNTTCSVSAIAFKKA